MRPQADTAYEAMLLLAQLQTNKCPDSLIILVAYFVRFRRME